MKRSGITIKSAADIEHLAAGGQILAAILDQLEQATRVGVKPRELDQLAQDLISQAGCRPSFLNYAPGNHTPFPAALCVSRNDEVVHGIPTDIPLADGEIVGLDVGLIYQDRYYLDSARTVIVGTASPETAHLLAVTKEALRRGIEAATIGHTVGDIGYAIQSYVEREGLGVVQQLVGHGVGFAVHEEPQVPNYGQRGTGLKLQPGWVIAIEPMVTLGDPEVVTADDDWTVLTRDGSLAAHQEHTVAVTLDGPRILTKK